MKVYKEYIEKSFDNTEDLFEYLNSDEEPQELIRCKDCKYYFKSDEKCQLIDTRLHFYEAGKRWTEDSFCSWAEKKDEYITLHPEDIHFNSEEDEKAFYEALVNMKNARSFTDEELEFYKKVNREKMQKTGLNISDFIGEERNEIRNKRLQILQNSAREEDN